MLDKLPRIKPGDSVSVIAPAGPINVAGYGRALQVLESRGIRVKTYRSVEAQTGYLAGSDAERVDELQQAIEDADTVAILPVRGGYGVSRLLDRIDFSPLRKHPKLVCGFSDITALHCAIHQHAGIPTLHSPNLQDGIGREPAMSDTSLARYWAWLTGTPQASDPTDGIACYAGKTFREGKVEGVLRGGNAAVLTALVGTPYAMQTEGTLLLLEDIGEEPYRIDRYLSQLKLAGVLDSVAGVVLGQFTDCEAEDPSRSFTIQEVLDQYMAEIEAPIIYDCEIGHIVENHAVPLNYPATIDADRGVLEVPALLGSA